MKLAEDELDALYNAFCSVGGCWHDISHDQMQTIINKWEEIRKPTEVKLINLRQDVHLKEGIDYDLEIGDQTHGTLS